MCEVGHMLYFACFVSLKISFASIKGGVHRGFARVARA